MGTIRVAQDVLQQRHDENRGRELRQHASRYLERVKAGETVEVTERGRLIALLVAPDATTSAR